MSGINPEPNPEAKPETKPQARPGVNPEENQGENPEVNTCTVITEYQGTTNVRKVEAVFSLKKNKFIRPIKQEGDRVAGKYVYELYPGKYIEVGYKYVARETYGIEVVNDE